MRRSAVPLLVLIAAVCGASLPSQAADKQTVCTITVNSPDEKEIFRRHLPASRYEFVELVESGRPDWLATSCQRAVACDVLIVSGHFDGDDHFFSDRLEASEYLTVSELERASCSSGCPSLFSRLKEVYLFGCNTLNPAAHSGASAEVVRSLVREAHSPREAGRQLQALVAQHGESSRDRMRQVFQGVPVIYGFSSSAPLGPVAGATLNRFLAAGGSRDVARGRPSASLLQHFAPFSMAASAGVTEGDARHPSRVEMCHFADERRSQADKLVFVHGLLQRPLLEVYQHLDRIQRLTRSLDDEARQAPAVARALDLIANDEQARSRFLSDTRSTALMPMRVRLIDIAHGLGWLSPDQRGQELALMLAELAARRELGVPEVHLACSLNEAGDLDGAFNRRVVAGGPEDDVAHAALRACLGSSEGHARTLQGLIGSDESAARVAQAYLRHRPVTDRQELHGLVSQIVAMPPSEAQVRALEALGRHYLSDPALLLMLTELFARTPSWAVQNAIAGILIRADRRTLPQAQLETALKEHRRPAPAGDDMIGALEFILRAH
jgi:hypothetical protein